MELSVASVISELRSYRRVPTNARVAADELSGKFPVDAKDISLGGLSIESRSGWPRGVQAVFKVTLHPDFGDEPLAVPGEVVWTRKAGNTYRTGVRFLTLNSVARSAIAEYVDRVCKDMDRI